MRLRSAFTEEEAKRWEQTREAGKRRFLLVDSILVRGVPFGLILTTANALNMLGVSSHRPYTVSLFLIMFAFHTLFFGLFVGLLDWGRCEKAYLSYRENLREGLQTPRPDKTG